MAPRGRPAKRGESRMDAALDAMAPFGFPNKLVRQTVAQLLKVYGGKEGWVFIEDSAYTLLIDTLLEKQQQEKQNVDPLPDQSQDCLLEDNPKNGPDDASIAGCSNGTLLPCAKAEASGDAPSTNQVVDTILTTSKTDNQPHIMAVDTTSPTNKSVNELLPIKPIDTSTATGTPSNQPPIEAVKTVLATGKNDIQPHIMAVDTTSPTSKSVSELLPIKPIDTSTATGTPSNQPPIEAVKTVLATGKNDNQVPIKAKVTVSAKNESESPQTKSSQPLKKHCHKRRKPCYGWIANDGSDEDELIELPAMA